MSDTTSSVDTTAPGTRYSERDDFVPDATHQFGTLDTSGTGGGAHQEMREITPVFDVADVEAAKVAAKALDPNDPTPESLVVLPQGSPMTVVDEQAIRDRISAKAESAGPVQILGPTPAQEEAAVSGTEGAEIAEEQQEGQGAGAGVTGDPDGLERQTGDEDDLGGTGSDDAPGDGTGDTGSTGYGQSS